LCTNRTAEICAQSRAGQWEQYGRRLLRNPCYGTAYVRDGIPKALDINRTHPRKDRLDESIDFFIFRVTVVGIQRSTENVMIADSRRLKLREAL
jgi:hypothetical protein